MTFANPCETHIIDRRGAQQALNHWVGLRTLIDRELPGMRVNSPWPWHKCQGCTSHIDVPRGETFRVQSASYDGVYSVRVRKCGVLDCREDLPSHGDTR